MCLALRDNLAKSPLSILMALSLCPCSFISLPTVMAFLMPSTVLYVSTSSVVDSGNCLAYALNASSSFPNVRTYECAIVPIAGISYIAAALRLLVP